MVMQLPGSTGITGKVGSKARVHVSNRNWGDVPFATDFWFSAANVDVVTASTPSLLSDNGWVETATVSVVNGSGADFFSSSTGASDYGTPTHYLCNATTESLLSPIMFGSYDFSYWIRQQLGWTPTKLIAEFFGLMTTASNSEQATGFGFLDASATTAPINSKEIAFIASDGTNFRGRTGALTAFTGASTGPVVDNVSHLWKIVIDGNLNITFFCDNTPFTTLQVCPTDLFPCQFAVGVQSGGSNVVGLGNTHVYYD